MDLYYPGSPAEKILQMKADQAKIPLGGSLELLPLCNMDCKMCYVRKTRQEMEAEGRMLSCDEWLRIADEGMQAGMLFLLLTGGEPLIYPEFKRLYVALQKKGLILSVNTNGTLIDEEWADFFARYGCRRLNITLYGKDDATYARLCGNPRGFTQVMNACRLLKERNLPFRLTCSVTPDNAGDLEELFAIAKSFDVPLSAAAYMFPGARRGVCADDQYRLSPEASAEAILKLYRLEHPEADFTAAAKQTLSYLTTPTYSRNSSGFPCHAGHSGFWMTWKGEMMACGMFDALKISLLEHSFADCWQYIVARTQAMTVCRECRSCSKQGICRICPAHCYTETGDVNGIPTYICRSTDAQIRLLEAHLRRTEGGTP